MVSSPDVFALCSPIVKAEYFVPEYRNLVSFLHKYYDEYNSLPDIKQVFAETNVELSFEDNISKAKLKYCCDEIEKHCKEEAMAAAVLKSAALVEKATTEGKEVDYGKIDTLVKEAMQVTLHKSLGMSLFENPEESLKEAVRQKPYALHWPEFDEQIEGGLRRQELILLAANSGGGKSIVMKNMGLQLAMHHKLNVLYLSLELPRPMIMKRFSSIVSRVAPRHIEEKMSEVADLVRAAGLNCGDIIIEEMPAGTRPYEIRAFLKEFELRRGFVPDVLIVDYIDLMYPNERVDLSDVFTRDKLTSEQLRQILIDYNMVGITASQLNRSAVNTVEHNHSHIAGGISKINTTDYFVTILLTETMKAQGLISFQFGKTRSSDAVGKTIHMGWDRSCLRVTVRQEKTKGLPTYVPKATREPGLGSPINSNSKSKLMSLFDEQGE